MPYFVEVKGNMIVSKHYAKTDISKQEDFPSNMIKISEEKYNEIGAMPCKCEIKEGKIVDIEYIEEEPKPEKKTKEEELQEEINSLKASIAELTTLISLQGVNK